MIGLIGVLVLPALAWLLSAHRRAVNWRVVGAAFGLQVAFGALVLYLPPGEAFLGALAGGVTRLLEFSRAGIDFVFGELASDSFGFVFALRVLPTIVFFAALISVLYHIGVMTWVVRTLGGLLQRALGTSRPESLAAAANIFVGQVEAPLVVRPFVPTMTASELFAVMTGGLATIAGAIIGGYAAMGIELKYLIAASFMAAPGGLMMAKIVMPEVHTPQRDSREIGGGGDPSAGQREGSLPAATEPSHDDRECLGGGSPPAGREPSAGEGEGTPSAGKGSSAGQREGAPPAEEDPSTGEREGTPPAGKDPSVGKRETTPSAQSTQSVNLFDAIASGALTGLRIAAAVGAMLIAFVGLIAMLNGLAGWLGGFVGAPDLSIQQLLGWLFRPLAWVIGVPWQDAGLAGSFIGQKLVANEFVAYLDFLRHRQELAESTRAIVTFALCGFANFSSIAILLGGLGAIAPERREDIARFGLRALLAASLANLMSAALAGVFLGL